ncbi:hypothetical protein ACWEVO_31390, partial [Micromonospora sp. NPDC003776]
RRRDGGPVRDRGPEITELVPAARTAAHILATQGTPLSRKGLARQLRADGRHLSNATASALARVLRAEAIPPGRGPSSAEPVTSGGRVTDRQPATSVRPRRPGQTSACQEAAS